MIVPITGNVAYTITLDPTVWIFDDRKILFDDAFTQTENKVREQDDELKKASERWSREVHQQKINPPVNRSISKFEREKILKSSYVMPIKNFLAHAEVKDDAKEAILNTTSKDVKISLEQLNDSLLLFAVNGKPLKDDGPVHLYFKDESNKENPIKEIQKIIIR